MIIQQAVKVLELEAEGIIKLKERINNDFVEMVELICNSAGRLIIGGIGKSGIVGRKIVATLNSTGTRALFLHPVEAMHGDLGIVSPQDIFLALSNSGETDELNILVPSIRKIGCKIIAFTGNNNSTLAKLSDIVIDVGVEKEACPYDLAPTASTTATMVMGDCLAVALLTGKGFKREDFAFLHPGGNLGKQFIKVEEEMLVGDQVPVINDNGSMKDAILIMTKNRGITCVVNSSNELIGVITYGDLGRAIKIYSNIFDVPVSAIMNEKPKTIKKDELAIKAVTLMEKYGITALIVVDDEKLPIGIIHLHDLMRIGVV